MHDELIVFGDNLPQLLENSAQLDADQLNLLPRDGVRGCINRYHKGIDGNLIWSQIYKNKISTILGSVDRPPDEGPQERSEKVKPQEQARAPTCQSGSLS